MARELDVRGLHCPLPILRTRRQLDHMVEGEELIVLVTDLISQLTVLILLVIVLMTVWRGYQRFVWRRDMGRQVQWLYLLVGLGMYLVIGLHGTLGAELAGEFGVHITADQLLTSGADLRQALP